MTRASRAFRVRHAGRAEPRGWHSDPASGYTPQMPEPYADTLATVAAGRTALVARLRTIAARLEALPLRRRRRGAGAPRADRGSVRARAALALERAPTGAQ